MHKYSPDNHIRGVTASLLTATSDRKLIQDIVADQIRTVDKLIQTAHSAGFNHTSYVLPTNFHINNMNKFDAQTIIYSDILMAYKKPESEGGKGFESVFIDMSTKTIFIRWFSGMDAEEREYRMKLISSCKIKKSQ